MKSKASANAIEGEAWAGRGRWAFASVVIGLSQAWMMHVVLEGSQVLNAGRMLPIFILGSIGWLFGCFLGILGMRAEHKAAKIAAIAGVVGNLAGLLFAWWSYAKWWVA